MSHAPIGTVCNCNERGWMPGIEHAPIQWGAPDWTRVTTMRPLAIVDHIMQGYLSTLVDWTRTGGSTVIVHFGIARSGRTVQMHSIFSPGIHAGGFDTSSQYAAAIVKARRDSPNGWSVGIEHEGCSVDPAPAYSVPAALIYSTANPWPDAMVDASIRVKRWVFANATSLGAPSRANIIGHYETGDGSRVNDPAAALARSVWPVDRMIAALAPAEAPAYVDRDYTVIRPGEWLSRVASRVGLTVAQLAELNAIADVNRVTAWQALRLNARVPIPEAPAQAGPDVAALRAGLDKAAGALASARVSIEWGRDQVADVNQQIAALRQLPGVQG